MNTKFPINGRYTTLGDLIHEYAKYSSYPEDMLDYTGIDKDNYDLPFKTQYGIWDTSNYSMPFIQLIYNGFETGSEKAQKPYNVVWFDNVYGTRINSLTRAMEIIQEADSSSYNFDTPIIAGKIKDKQGIKDGNFKFRFIIPDAITNKPDHFYYNYRTSENEAVVMYALRNLISINPYSKYYFGKYSYISDYDYYSYTVPSKTISHLLKYKITYDYTVETLDPSTDVSIYETYTDNTVERPIDRTYILDENTFEDEFATREYFIRWEKDQFIYTIGQDNIFVFKLSDVIDITDPNNRYFRTVINDNVSNYTKTISTTNKSTTYYLTKFEPISWNNRTDGKLLTDEELALKVKYGNTYVPIFNIKDEKNYIFNINDAKTKITSLKPDAYKYLGDYFWTLSYVLLPNYTTLNTYDNFFVPDKFINEFEKLPNFINSTFNPSGKPEDLITKIANEMATNAPGSEDTESKGSDPKYYYENSINYKKKPHLYSRILYFLKLFLNSQRFFVSHITAFEYVNISNKSYAEREPILRCDLGLFRVIEYIQVLSAEHLINTALPAGPLNPNINITIKASIRIKYENIPKYKDDEILINYTLKDFYKLNSNYKEPDENNKIHKWVTLVEGTNNFIVDSSVWSESEEANRCGFPEDTHFLYPVVNTEDKVYSDCSLGTLKWPNSTSISLDCGNARTFETAVNSINYPNTGQGASLTSDPKLYPVGYNWDKFKEEKLSPFGYLRIHDYLYTKQPKSSMYINVGLYRCNNWYYTENEASDYNGTIRISAFFDPPIKNSLLPTLPLVLMAMYKSTYGLGNDIMNFSDILEGINSMESPFSFTANPTDCTNTYFTSYISQAKRTHYASGAVEVSEENIGAEQIDNSLDLYIDILTDQNTWKQIGTVYKSLTLYTEKCYQLMEPEFRENNNTFTLGRVYHKAEDMENCFYFKITKPENSGTPIYIEFLQIKDTKNISKSNASRLNLVTTSDIKINCILYNNSTTDTADMLHTSKSNTLTLVFRITRGTHTNPFYFIDDENNKISISSLTSSGTFGTTIYLDYTEYTHIFNLFFIGQTEDGKITKPVFLNPTFMFGHYKSNDNELRLGSRIIRTNNELITTANRAIYVSIDPIYVFCNILSPNTRQNILNVNIEGCKLTDAYLSSITYNNNDVLGTLSYTDTAPVGICSIAAGNSDVYITTGDITVKNDNNTLKLSEYLTLLKESSILFSMVISLYTYGNNDELKYDASLTPVQMKTVSEHTPGNTKLFTCPSNCIMLLTYNVSLYKESINGDWELSITKNGNDPQIICIQTEDGTMYGNKDIDTTESNLSNATAAANNYLESHPLNNGDTIWLYISNDSLLSVNMTDKTTKYFVGWDINNKQVGLGTDSGKLPIGSLTISVTNTISGNTYNHVTVTPIFNTIATIADIDSYTQTYGTVIHNITPPESGSIIYPTLASYPVGQQFTVECVANPGYILDSVYPESGTITEGENVISAVFTPEV